MIDLGPGNQRPEERLQDYSDKPMEYPISILWGELQRVKHKIDDLKGKQSRPSQPLDVQACTGELAADGQSLNAAERLVAFREQQTCIGALEAKVARLGEAIHKLGLRCGCQSLRPGEEHPNLLHLELLIKHFPNLAGSATDIRMLRHLEVQAYRLEGQS